MKLFKSSSLILISAFLYGLMAQNIARAQETTSGSCEKYDPAWQSCSQDSDCVSSRNVCGFPIAYNKRSLEAAEKYNKCMGPVTACPQLLRKDPKSIPVCKSNTCSLEALRLPNHVYAEVAGVLHFQEGQGYFISVKNDEFDTENQIWLRISEDKVMVARLQELTNREVIARGSLGQMPDTVNSAVPKGGIYLGDISFIDDTDEGARPPE